LLIFLKLSNQLSKINPDIIILLLAQNNIAVDAPIDLPNKIIFEILNFVRTYLINIYKSYD